eukprot:3713759-Pyramimonas_sp.AAC.1
MGRYVRSSVSFGIRIIRRSWRWRMLGEALRGARGIQGRRAFSVVAQLLLPPGADALPGSIRG